MPYCAVLECKYDSRTKNSSNGGISYHRFPKDPDRKEKWIEATGRQCWFPAKTSAICSDHFVELDFSIKSGKKYLADTAVPKQKIIHFQNQDSPSTGNEIKVFCPKCNTEVSHTARGIQEDQKKIFVAKVYHYFEQEFEELKKMYGDLDLTPLSRFWQRTALATGVSETTVREILKEEQARNADKRQEPPKKRRTAPKRPHQTASSSEENSSDENVEDGGQSSFAQIAQKEPEIETLVVKIEPSEYYKEQPQFDPISVEVKAEPPDDDNMNNTNETLALNEPAGTKRKGRKIPRTSDVTSSRQHPQGESSTAAAASSDRLAELLHESGLGGTEVKLENIEIDEEGFS